MNAEIGKSEKKQQKVVIESRNAMEVNGVTDVISFDEQSVVLSTVCGNLNIEGSQLHIHVLSMEQGIVTLDGNIDSITYYAPQNSEGNEKGGFFGKLFR